MTKLSVQERITYVLGLIYFISYRVFIKYCVFFLRNVVIFLNSASSAAAMVFYLSSGCLNVKSGVHTLTPRENGERSEFGIF